MCMRHRSKGGEWGAFRKARIVVGWVKRAKSWGGAHVSQQFVEFTPALGYYAT